MGEIRHAYTNAVADGTATSVVRPSDWNSVHLYTMQDGVSLGGNTAGVLTGINSGTLFLAGGNNITLSQNGNSVTVSAGAGGAASSATVSDAAGSGTIARLAFTNLNGVTLSLSTGAAGLHTIVGSHNALTTAMASDRGSDFIQATAGFNGTNISGTLQSNSISLSVAAPGLTTAMASNRGSDFVQATATIAGTSISGTIASNGMSLSVGPYITTAMASNRGSDFVAATAAFAGTNASGTIASNGISVSVGNYITTAMASNRGSDFVAATAAFAGTSASGTIASNGISVSIGPYITTAMASNRASDFVAATAAFAGTSASGTIASNGISVSIGPYITTADLSANTSNYFRNWKLTGNTAGTTSSAQGTDLWFQGGNSITVSGSSNSIVFSVGNYLTTAMASNRGSDFVAATAAFAGTNASGTIASNGISVSVGAGGAGDGGVFAGVSTGGNTAGSTGTVSTGNFVLVGSNGITLSQSTGAAGSAATVTLAGWPHVSYFANVGGFQGVQTMTMLQSTSGMFPFFLQAPLSVGFVRLVEGWNVAASSTAATTGNTQFSAGHTRSHNFVIYSRGVGANSMSLQYVTSSQVTQQQSINISANANSTQFSYTNRLTLPAATGNFGLTKDYSSSAASLNFHTSNLTDITGTKLVDYPFAFSLAPGQYFLGYGVSSSTQSQFTNQITRLLAAGTNFGVSQANSAYGTLGSATNSSVNIQPGLGSFSTAGGGTTSSVELTRLSSSASQNLLYFQFMRIQ